MQEGSKEDIETVPRVDIKQTNITRIIADL